MNCYLTTIPIEPKILTEFEVLKLKTCSLYHENLLLQKLSDMYTMAIRAVEFSNGGYKIRKMFA